MVSGSNNTNQNRDDLGNADVYVVVENESENIATTTVTDVRGTFTSVGAAVHRKTNIYFHDTEDRSEMPPKEGTDHEQYQAALAAAVLLLMHHVVAPCPSFYHCQPLG